MVAFGEAGRLPGGLGVEAGRGRQVAVALVQVGGDGGVAGQGGVELGQGGQAGPRAVGLADRDGPVEAGHRAAGEAHQFVVPLDDLHPVGLLGRPGVGVQRGDGGLGLELAEPVAGERRLEHVDALGDQAGVPQAAVLLGERHEPAVGRGPRRAPGVVEQHEGEQARDLLVVVDRGRSWRVSRIASAARSTSPE